MTSIIEFIIVNAILLFGGFLCLIGMNLADAGAFMPAKECLGLGICLVCVIIAYFMTKP